MTITIRPVEVKDARGINMLRRENGIIQTTLGLPSERVMIQENFLLDTPDHIHTFVAISTENNEEEVVGWASMNMEKNQRKRHSASLALLIHPKYQEHELSYQLLEMLIDLADNWLLLKRLEMTLLSGNMKVQQLYEQFGFVQEGIKKNSIISNGKYCDEVCMARLNKVSFLL